MVNRSLIIGQLIANAHPVDVRLLFQRYGITAPPTGKTILDAYLVHGAPFLTELAAIADQNKSRFSAMAQAEPLETNKLILYADGKAAQGTAAQTADTAAKVSWTDKLFSVFDTAGQTLTTVSGAWDKISNIFTGNKTVATGSADANAALQAEMYRLQNEAANEAAANSTKTYLLIGGGILVLVLIGFMYFKNK